MTDNPVIITCDYPVSRRGHLGRCKRRAAWSLIVGTPDGRGSYRHYCTPHRSGILAPYPWEVLSEVDLRKVTS
jgi:hypothetical protein